MRMPSALVLIVAAACGGAVDPAQTAAAQQPPAQSEAQSPAVADPRPANAPNQKPAFDGQTDAPVRATNVAFQVVTAAEGLEHPWALAFLPSGKMLVTERPGRLRVVATDGAISAPVAGLPAIDTRNQGGLLDVALDPDFVSNQLIYWSFSEPQANGENNTAVARGRLVDNATAPRVEKVEVIYHQRPSMSSTGHYGSRLVFGGDGTLFVTQGDRMIEAGRAHAQKLESGIGKVVRINRNGTIPKDNPFAGREGARPEIWSIGHRNVQSAALHPSTGDLWVVEHGTRGGDELNIVRKGKDYGWPTIGYGIEYRGGAITGGLTQKEGMEQPAYYWDPVIAPSGMLFYTGDLFPAWKNSLFIGGLVTKTLVRLDLDGERVTGEERLLTDLKPEAERIRDVRQGPDGAIYLVTDNPKGRVLKVVPRR
ncbi:MAG: PQQ-dependent sugar dehydrogenase [Acidobacteriota bacterium]|nr:PQQ-dependent sugar dehydrogenase [Acidobacteriota bacterium]